MTDVTPNPVDPTEPAPPELAVVRPPRPGLELCVVLLVGVLPHLAYAVITVLFDPSAFDGNADLSFAIESGWHIASSLGIIAAMLWIMRQSGEPWSFFGFRRVRPGRDLAAGAALYALHWVFFMVFGYAIAVILETAGFDPWADPFETGALARPTHPLDVPMIVAVSAANAPAEQLVITAYLISRLRSRLGNAPAALGIAVALFASYHVYQGSWGFINAAVFMLILGAYYCYARRIWPCVVAHFLGDLIPFLLAYVEA